MFRFVSLTVICVLAGALCDVSAKPLKIAFGLTIPPYVIKEEGRGLEFEIIKEALAHEGYDIDPVYVPLARTIYMLKKHKVDGIMSTGFKDIGLCHTEPYITYWNFAITLKSQDHQITSVSDLAGLNVLAFQNARNYLGEAFRAMASNNPEYSEIANQSSQNKMLLTKRTDVVIADRYIFDWYHQKNAAMAGEGPPQEVVYHNIFPPSHFGASFIDENMCEVFNRGVAKLRKSGRYDEIIRSYGMDILKTETAPLKSPPR